MGKRNVPISSTPVRVVIVLVISYINFIFIMIASVAMLIVLTRRCMFLKAVVEWAYVALVVALVSILEMFLMAFNSLLTYGDGAFSSDVYFVVLVILLVCVGTGTVAVFRPVPFSY